jgi:hypothetical protein
MYPGLSVARARETFPWCRRLDLLSLVVTLPLLGAWRVYAALCTDL